MIGVLLVVGFAVWELANNNITLGGVLAFVAYLTQLYGPIQGIGNLANELFSAERQRRAGHRAPRPGPAVVEPADPTHWLGPVEASGEQYHVPATRTRTSPRLSDIDFTVEPGQRIALVGASGAGKSTLTKLLLRFFDPTRGPITPRRARSTRPVLSRPPAQHHARAAGDARLRRHDPRQHPLGRPDATEEDVIAAATAADAHSFINQLAQGYDTRIGQRGRLLSGGQRQRIAIARAMIRDTPVLLLDEPTTGLDAESTQRILAPLRRLMAGRTTIVISHNLLTVTDADRILYLENGRITATGTHTELLAASPGYAELYRLHAAPAKPRPTPRPRESPEANGAVLSSKLS